MRKSNLTPLGASTLAFMLSNRGFDLSKSIKTYIGTASTEQGSLNTTIHGAVLEARTTSAALLDSNPTEYTQEAHAAILGLGKSSIPALMNTAPVTFTEPDTVNGFTGKILQTAITEVRPGNGGIATFVNSVTYLHSYMSQHNDMIIPLHHSKDHMAHLFSNMDDLMSSDVCGINKATLLWGTDLVKSGRVIDLSNIATFGLPSNLLFTIRANNGQTSSLSTALMLSGLLPDEINTMFDTKKVSTDQEKKLYNAFSMIQNNDLSDILTPLNCQTTGLTSLADLLDPQKLFPNSYASLTVPIYNKIDLPTNSKTYYLIYHGGVVDEKFLDKADYLLGIIPTKIATACAALSYAMRQVKNISDMKIEKFSKMVVNMESSSDLNLGLTTLPSNTAVISAAHSALALGSESDGSYIFDDFFGAATGLRSEYSQIQSLIEAITATNMASNLTTLLADLNDKLAESPVQPTISSDVISIVTEINSELLSIQSSQSEKVSKLNTLWNAQSLRMAKASINRTAAFTGISFNDIAHGPLDVYAFVNALRPYAMETMVNDTAAVIESLTDGTESGDTIIAYMRECRNTERINSAGGMQDNEIEVPERINTQVPGIQAGAVPIEKPSNVATIGSLAGNNESNLIPLHLDAYGTTHLSGTIMSVQDAINDVIDCNCDCWDILSS